MKITLLDHTQDPAFKIGLMAAECYDAKTDRESCIRRAMKCKEDGHLATLRFAYATFKVEGISRTCSHQLVRHAHLSYLQKSQRYTEDNGDIVIPPSIDTPEKRDAFNKAIITAQDSYQALRDAGVVKGDARFVLPQACTTSMNVTGNFQAWADFIKLRTDKHAQWEVREVALEIQCLLRGIAPEIF